LAVPSGKGDTSVVLISTGQVIGELSSNGKGVKSGPLVSGDTIFAHSDNGQLWRFRADTLAVSGCIKANGDGQRCG
jgi:outer membrane protein assembly factor BamB